MIRAFDQNLDNKDELKKLVFASQKYQKLQLEEQDITDNELEKQWSELVDQHLIDKQTIYLVAIDGTMQGFVRAELNTKRNEAFIDDLFVDPEYRSQGIGGQLIDAAKVWAGQNDAKRMRLAVHNTNETARHLYQQAGFQEIDPEYIDMQFEVKDPDNGRE